MPLLLLPLHGAFLVIFAAMVLVKTFAFIDAASRRATVFPAAGKRTKQFWVLLLAAALLTTFMGFLSLAGLVAALVYLVDVRPAIREVPRGGSTTHMGPYGPW
ncbi:MAG: hypothetical protein QOJ03_821 [Frankiaceae bacterium]|jgi:hypothetical protein|nr:hypothetical protein [Frankiaceae bacterium]